MAELGGAVLALVGGGVVGLASCALWLALKLPMRIMDVAGAGSAGGCGWAIASGTLLGTLWDLMGWTLGGGIGLLIVFMLLAGMFVGMVASALTEVLDVLPQGIDRMGLGNALGPLTWALALGKMIGALAGVLLRLWPSASGGG